MVGILFREIGLFLSEKYPVSVTDSDVTQMSGVIHMVEIDHEIMADRGVLVPDLFFVKGLY